jgi:hypothetical protein
VVESALTHPCPSFAMGKLAMVVVQVQGAPTAHSLLFFFFFLESALFLAIATEITNYQD